MKNARTTKKKIDELQKLIEDEQKQSDSTLKNLNSQLSSVKNKLGGSSLNKSQKEALEKQKSALKTKINRLSATSSSKQTKVASTITKDAKKQAKDALSKTKMTKEDTDSLSRSVKEVKEVLDTQPQVAYPAIDEIDEAIQSKIESDESVPSELLDIADDVTKLKDDYRSVYENQESDDLSESLLDERMADFAEINDLEDGEKDLLFLGALSELLEEYGPVDDNMSVDDLNQEQRIIKLKIDKLLSSLLKSDINVPKWKMALIDKKVNNAELYATAEETAIILGRKYVWDSNLVRGWIVGKDKKYCFTHGKNNVVVSDDYHRIMANVALFENTRHELESTLWLPKSFLMDEYTITVQGVKTVNKSIIYSESSYEMMKKALEHIK